MRAPACREASVCELAAVLLAPGQIGYQPTMNRGAPLGFFFVGHQVQEAVPSPRDAEGCVSVRHVGATSRVHPAT